jgi:hypothetical protein
MTSKIIGKSAEKSALGDVGYRSGTKLYSQYANIDFDYTIKRNVTFSENPSPENVPELVKDREKLWHTVES